MRLLFWQGGINHDWCYHNTVDNPGYTKRNCDLNALNTWLDSCNNLSEIEINTFTKIIEIALRIINPLSWLVKPPSAQSICIGLALAYSAGNELGGGTAFNQMNNQVAKLSVNNKARMSVNNEYYRNFFTSLTTEEIEHTAKIIQMSAVTANNVTLLDYNLFQTTVQNQVPAP